MLHTGVKSISRLWQEADFSIPLTLRRQWSPVSSHTQFKISLQCCRKCVFTQSFFFFFRASLFILISVIASFYSDRHNSIKLQLSKCLIYNFVWTTLMPSLTSGITSSLPQGWVIKGQELMRTNILTGTHQFINCVKTTLKNQTSSLLQRKKKKK